MLVFMLSLGGIPPTAGFMGKFWLFGAAIEAGYVWLAVIGVLNSAVSLYYYVRVVVFMWIKEEIDGPVAAALLAGPRPHRRGGPRRHARPRHLPGAVSSSSPRPRPGRSGCRRRS